MKLIMCYSEFPSTADVTQEFGNIVFRTASPRLCVIPLHLRPATGVRCGNGARVREREEV
ncbi:hypothetical protein E2C01_033441 [Portunus trituberculatus]|uniref:Uncharacterized protein n=1 Tax=Portunus trituberculatus TaxID=210409 RepID=A0A5B7F3R4_PORTR|nr:hypothetical protein [Portunus trituberculatus]